MKKSFVLLFTISFCSLLFAQTPVKLNDSTLVYDVADNLPIFNGGIDSLMKFLSTNIKYPVEAQAKKIEGKVVIGFIVDESGKVTLCNVVRSVETDLDAEALRVVSSMPNWIPGKVKGKNVKCRFYVPINFKLEKEQYIDSISNQNTVSSEQEKIFEVVETPPSFPGGDAGLMKYISQNVKYPVKAQEYGVMGKIIVQFIIDTNGEITDVHTVRSIFTVLEPKERAKKYNQSYNGLFNNSTVNNNNEESVENAKKELEHEAMRVIKAIPNWNPGKQKGNNVKCKYYVPINFKLQ